MTKITARDLLKEQWQNLLRSEQNQILRQSRSILPALDPEEEEVQTKVRDRLSTMILDFVHNKIYRSKKDFPNAEYFKDLEQTEKQSQFIINIFIEGRNRQDANCRINYSFKVTIQSCETTVERKLGFKLLKYNLPLPNFDLHSAVVLNTLYKVAEIASEELLSLPLSEEDNRVARIKDFAYRERLRNLI